MNCKIVTDKKELINFIKLSDNCFVPSLSSRVNLIHFTNKILKNGFFYELKKNEQIVALIGGYNNEPIAYISYLCVKEDFRGFGFSDKLLNHFIYNCKKNNNFSIRLTVKKNSSAFNLYKKNNFQIINEFVYENSHDAGYTMELVL